ncbi:hypothetical protein ACEQ8H_003119 [Pleosporales sp. CAS-2024a]
MLIFIIARVSPTEPAHGYCTPSALGRLPSPRRMPPNQLGNASRKHPEYEIVYGLTTPDDDAPSSIVSAAASPSQSSLVQVQSGAPSSTSSHSGTNAILSKTSALTSTLLTSTWSASTPATSSTLSASLSQTSVRSSLQAPTLYIPRVPTPYIPQVPTLYIPQVPTLYIPQAPTLYIPEAPTPYIPEAPTPYNPEASTTYDPDAPTPITQLPWEPVVTRNSTMTQSTSAYSSPNATVTGTCTGCVIEAYRPITTSFTDDPFNSWTTTQVTATIVTSVIKYNDTTVMTSTTLNITRTVTDSDNQTITATTPVFVVTPAPGTRLTLDAGPTYVIYTALFGGLDKSYSEDFPFPSMATTDTGCRAEPTRLKNWKPARTQDWSYFITSYLNGAPTVTATNIPYPLPSPLLQYLKNNSAIQSQFHGSDIATCTLRPTAGLSSPPHGPFPIPGVPPPVAVSPTQGPAPRPSPTTNTYIASTYVSTTTYITVQGCLRCKNTQLPPVSTPVVSFASDKGLNAAQPEPTQTQPGQQNQANPPDTSSNPNGNQNGATPGNGNGGSSNGGGGSSNGNGGSNNQSPPGNAVQIGDSTYTVRPGQQTPGPDQPSNQNLPLPVVIIGTQTLTQGQSTVINNVPVVVPTGASPSRVIVGGTTYVVNNGPSATTVLTVGAQTVPATLVGGTTELVIGGQTLLPGGPPVVIAGTTYSLPSSAGTTQIVINGATSALAPDKVINNLVPSFTVVSGTTAFVLAPGQTLTPGAVLTLSGTTYSMPASASGSIVVVNGVTSTLSPNNAQTTAAPQLTINSVIYTPTTRDGTTEYVVAPGETLRPGQAITISGVAYSLDSQGTVLVINGQTSSIARGPASASASTTASASTSGQGAGDFIWSGIGGGAASSTSHSAGGKVRVDSFFQGLVVCVTAWLMTKVL